MLNDVTICQWLTYTYEQNYELFRVLRSEQCINNTDFIWIKTWAALKKQ